MAQLFPELPGPGDKEQQERSAELQRMVKDLLRHVHVQNSAEAICLPDADGVFPPASFWKVSLVVVDANTLRNDILYACRHEGTPTTLVNGANSQMLRLFCAKHVFEELNEHYREWCDEADVPVGSFVERFKTSYAPLLRAIAEVPEGLLSAEEQSRVEVLRGVDPDDIPSVTLALLLQAFYLSTDIHACEAVYGGHLSTEEVQQWLAVLRAGGDAGVIGSLFQAGAMLTGLLGQGLWGAFDGLTRGLNPWVRLAIAGIIVGAGAYLYRRQPEEHRQSFRTGLWRALEVAGAFTGEYLEATTRLGRSLPAAPDWERLADEQRRDHVLARACLRELARARSGHLSAVELAELLPRLGVGQSAPKVREVLRARPGCFDQVYPGRWQVGTALVHALRGPAVTG